MIQIQSILHILSSISLLVVIYLINHGIGIGSIIAKLGIPVKYDLPQWMSYIVYIILTIGYAGILTLFFKRLRPGELRNQNIEQLDADNSGLLAMMLTYVFVGLSVNNNWALLIVIISLLIFNLCLCDSMHIYNPLFYIFGYHYYYVSSSKIKILVMTRTKYPLGANADFKNCGCLNDYTYIDISKKNE